MQVNPYLNFNGECEAAFRFYTESLGMRVGGAIVMGSDVPAERYQKPRGFAVSLQVETPEEDELAFRLCRRART